MSDRFKKPWHPSFSTDSDAARTHPDLAGRWDGERYIETPAHRYMMTLSDEGKVAFAKLTPEQRAAVLARVGAK
jgi:hypothetical protein